MRSQIRHQYNISPASVLSPALSLSRQKLACPTTHCPFLTKTRNGHDRRFREDKKVLGGNEVGLASSISGTKLLSVGRLKVNGEFFLTSHCSHMHLVTSEKL